jgi:hypothetical protein
MRAYKLFRSPSAVWIVLSENLTARRKCLEEAVTPSDLPGFVFTSVLTPRIFEGISRRFTYEKRRRAGEFEHGPPPQSRCVKRQFCLYTMAASSGETCAVWDVAKKTGCAN